MSDPPGSHSLCILVDLSRLLARRSRRERAAEVLSAVLHHPSCAGSVRLHARQALDELASRLPTETLSALEARSEAPELGQLAAELLKEI